MKVLWNSIAVGLWVCLLAPGTWARQATGPAAKQKPIAEVAGKPVYEKDIAPQVKTRLIQLQHQEYEIKKQALDSYVQNQILTGKAKSEGLTTEALLKGEVDAKVPQPSDDAVYAYYLAQGNLRNRPFAEVKEQLRSALRRALIAQARQDFIDGLRAKADVRIFIHPPRFKVSYEAARLRGNPHAPVTIIEFSDFQCPFCRAAEATLRKILAKYPDKVSLAYRDFPLRNIHPYAQKAAEAARCAQAQGKFWAYHDRLMQNPPQLDVKSLEADARSLHLNEKEFDSCLSTDKYAPEVQKDVDAGRSLGVSGTPGFFINGEFLSGAQPESVFEKMIQADLNSAKQPRRLAKR